MEVGIVNEMKNVRRQHLSCIGTPYTILKTSWAVLFGSTHCSLSDISAVTICSFVSSGRKFKYEILINVDLNLVCLLEMERNQLNYIFEYLIPDDISYGILYNIWKKGT